MDSKNETVAAGPRSHRPSELSDLLQIISGSSTLIEKISEGRNGSDKYFTMLRRSIRRAEKIVTDLVQEAGGLAEKTVFHPELAAFARAINVSSPTPLTQTVLVVEDERMALALAERTLSEAGYEVVTAQSGFECLDLLRSRPRKFNLILLDFAMPFMSGEETFSRLRGIRPEVPVVLTTGFIEQERLDRMINAGLCGFIRKPYGPNELTTYVKAMLQRIHLVRAGAAPNLTG
jgi:CheY-like chemotaxis protein